MNDVKQLIGRVVRKVEVNDSRDDVYFIFDHDAYRFYHLQDCCETVALHDIFGDVNDLIDCPILEASEDFCSDWPNDVNRPCCVDSYTWTTYIFRTEKGTVVFRWLGQSNGYYGETPYCHLTHKPIDMG